MTLLHSLKALRERQSWVLLHRWVGLVMTLFLVVAGLTGSLIAFYGELDTALSPGLMKVHPPAPDAPMLDAVSLLERVLAARPDLQTDSAIAPWQRDRALTLWLVSRDGARTETDDEFFVDPYTGVLLGSRRWGDLTQGTRNLMPFVYHLHYTLALGTIGTYAFGIAALLWTLDCFIGAYLTFPRGRPFLGKWKTAWQLRFKRLNFDLHRAGGLWTWAMLFVLAWSSVALNLGEVYEPVTRAVLGFAPRDEEPHAEVEQAVPGLSWRAAYERGQALMRTAVAERRVEVFREDALRYDAHGPVFNYWVATKFRDDGEAYDWLGVRFDANTGAALGVMEEDIGTGRERAGDIVTRWLIDLHMANVWGLPYRIFVCVMGLVVTALSVTGLVIWWRKRRARRTSASRSDRP